MAKRTPKAKEPIRIRFKTLASGSKSLYLDYYKDGKREYEFLKLYLIPEKTPFDKRQNEETLRAANAIKAERVISITNDDAGLKKASTSKLLLLDYMEHYKEFKASEGKKDDRQIKTCMDIIRVYDADIRLSNVDKKFCSGFIHFLLYEYKSRHGKGIRAVTAKNYYRVLNSALNKAVRDGIISSNPFQRLEQSELIKVPESKRGFLVAEELKKLENTAFYDEATKRAFLFACFCGMRWGDVSRLKWGDIQKVGDVMTAFVVQHKTKEPLTIPLILALRYLPERNGAKDEDFVFCNLKRLETINVQLKTWAKDAQISKSISFHTARHTYATLLLTKGVDVSVIQSLLGHSDIKTTQIYAKIVNQARIDAVKTLNNI